MDINWPLLLVSFAITLVVYGVFPILFSVFRKSEITATKYNVICFVVNFIVAIFVKYLMNSTSNFAPCILWTVVFTAIGRSNLKSKNALIEKDK